MADYTYSVENDTASGAVDPDTLKIAVEAAAIAPDLTSLHCAGDVLTLAFDSGLSGAEVTTLDGVIGAHTGTPVAKGTMIRLANGTVYEATSFSAGAITWTEVS